MANAWVEPSFARKASATSSSRSKVSSVNNINGKHPPLKRQFSSCDNDDKNCDSSRLPNKPKGFSIDAFEPKNAKDLAVSRQKLTELRNWFSAYFVETSSVANGRSPFLLLNGPSGSGKTAAVKVIAREMNVECVELPVTSIFNDNDLVTEGFQSLSLRSTRHTEWDGREEVRPLHTESQLNRFRHFIRDLNYMRRSALSEERVEKILLIEEIPNAFVVDPDLLHEELKLFVARFKSNAVPLVFIISDTVNGTSLEHKILPKSVLARFNFNVITFKPITPIAMTKALSATAIGQMLSKNEISVIVESSPGDIRHAFNSLLFKYSGSIVNSTASLKNHKKLKKSRVERPKLDIDCSRQEALTVTHAIAKMLYAKRLDEVDPEAVALARAHPTMDRSLLRNALKESKPEEIAERANMTSDSVIEWLHENYTDFIFSNELDAALDSIQILSEADSIFSDFESKNTVEEMRSLYLTRGMMFALNRDRSAYADVLGESAQSKPKTTYTFHQLRASKQYQQHRDISENRAKVNEIKDGLFYQLCQVSSDADLVLDVLPLVNSITPDLSRDLGLSNFVNYLTDFQSRPYHSREFRKPTNPDAPVWLDHCPSTSGSIPMEIDSDTIEDDSD